jgi:hypothetical protein
MLVGEQIFTDLMSLNNPQKLKNYLPVISEKSLDIHLDNHQNKK